MSDVTVEHKESLSREQVAAWLHELSQALHEGGEVALPPGFTAGASTTVSLRPPDEVQAEVEVEVDGAEVQIRGGAELVHGPRRNWGRLLHRC